MRAPSAKSGLLPGEERVELANGLTVHLYPNGNFPLWSTSLVFFTGGAYDPPEHLGVSDFATALARRGAEGIPAAEIAVRLEGAGAAMGAHASEELVLYSAAGPTDGLSEAMALLGAMVRSPDYPEQEVDIGRRRALGRLANDVNDSSFLAERAMSRMLWGRHPYGRDAWIDAAAIGALPRSALISWRETRLKPRGGHLYFAGATDVDATLREIEQHFGSWEGTAAEMPSVPAPRGLAVPGRTWIVDKPELTQVQVRIGMPSGPHVPGDHLALIALHAILGGAFGSRLMTELRQRRSLTYGVESGFELFREGGVFTIASHTRYESVAELVEASLSTVQKLAAEGPKPLELKRARRLIESVYAARLETNEGLIGAIAEAAALSLPEDWVVRFRERIAALPLEEVRRAADTYLRPVAPSLVFVGSAEKLVSVARAFGDFTVVSAEEFA